MTSKIIYIAVFVFAFMLVTISIIFMNNQYTNIFQFDFTTAAEIKPAEIKKASIDGSHDLKTYIANMKDELLDSINTIKTKSKIDTVYAEVDINPLLADSIKKISTKIENAERELIAKNNEIENLKNQKKVNQDSAYVKWKKEMVKIYESMDAKAAARIIQNLGDNLAKDIIFSMKKKKAAEILMKLSPETASRLTRIE